MKQNAKTGLQFFRSDNLIDIKDSGRPAEADENKLKTLVEANQRFAAQT